MDDSGEEPSGRRLQFPLWFLLFVVPLIAGLAFMLVVNWNEQTDLRERQLEHQAALRSELVELTRAEAAAESLSSEMGARWMRWRTPAEVILWIESPAMWETRDAHFYEVPPWAEINCYFLHADQQSLETLVGKFREKYPTATDQTKTHMLSFARTIPGNSPQHAPAIAPDVQQWLDEIPAREHPVLKMKANEVRRAFGFPVVNVADEEAP